MDSVDFDWPIWMEYNSMKLNGQWNWFWLTNLNGIKFYEVEWTVLILIDQFEWNKILWSWMDSVDFDWPIWME